MIHGFPNVIRNLKENKQNIVVLDDCSLVLVDIQVLTVKRACLTQNEDAGQESSLGTPLEQSFISGFSSMQSQLIDK